MYGKSAVVEETRPLQVHNHIIGDCFCVIFSLTRSSSAAFSPLRECVEPLIEMHISGRCCINFNKADAIKQAGGLYSSIANTICRAAIFISWSAHCWVQIRPSGSFINFCMLRRVPLAICRAARVHPSHSARLIDSHRLTKTHSILWNEKNRIHSFIAVFQLICW